MGVIPPQQLIKKAMQHQQRGELRRAKEIYAKVLESSPGNPDALHLYGLACHQQGDHQAAVTYIRRAVELVPDQPVLRNNLGDALRMAGEFEDALVQLKTALDLRPDYAGAHQNLGSVYMQTSQHEAALEHARKAVQLDIDRPEAWFNLGLILLDHVLLQESANAFRKALELRPVYPQAATSLLYTLNLLLDTNPMMIAEEHCRVAAAAFKQGETEPSFPRRNERIRIGYVSGDFRAHAVSFFFEPVLEKHDRTRFETYCYSDVAMPDHVTRRLQAASQHWRDTSAWEDHRFIEQVKADRIDILVDLAGHTKHHRLGALASQPAPVQVSWLGFPNTTGLSSIAYRIVDKGTVPVDDDPAGSEALIRMPHGFACFRPPDHAPSVHAAPVIRNGFVTLGCLHKLEKLNEAVIALWARVLRENQTARLLIARDQLDDWQQHRLQTHFARHSVPSERLIMKQLVDPEKSFFELFADIDILLDSFPWSGHTLACCALWMGVPVVTLNGDRHAGRMVASVLHLVGMESLVAKDIASYADTVRELCANHEQLNYFRAELRDRLRNSPLRDETRFTKELENAFRRILKV